MLIGRVRFDELMMKLVGWGVAAIVIADAQPRAAQRTAEGACLDVVTLWTKSQTGSPSSTSPTPSVR